MTDGPVALFDRPLLRVRRDRMAARFDAHDFLFREIAARLADRLADVRRTFDMGLDLSARSGLLAEEIAQAAPDHVRALVQAEMSPCLAARARMRTGLPTVAGDEEALPFAQASFDLVMTGGALHLVNDVPGTLAQIRHVLKPDGLFLGAMLGGRTLSELRQAWLEAEAEIEGGASPRVAPFADLQDAAGLLQRAGFALPVADIDTITVTYENPMTLMADLRGMGEANVRTDRRRNPTRRATALAAAERYMARHAGPDGRAPATFQILFMTGWAPAESQPRPLRPGSATARLADALDAREESAGDAAGPGKE